MAAQILVRLGAASPGPKPLPGGQQALRVLRSSPRAGCQPGSLPEAVMQLPELAHRPALLPSVCHSAPHGVTATLKARPLRVAGSAIAVTESWSSRRVAPPGCQNRSRRQRRWQAPGRPGPIGEQGVGEVVACGACARPRHRRGVGGLPSTHPHHLGVSSHAV
jgi:hypothetical protein